MSSLPPGTTNLGEPRGVDFGAIGGEQFFEVCAENPVSVETPTVDAASIELHPATPNPFNPSTELSFTIRTTSHIQVSIYDTGGRLVRRLIDGKQLVAGRHSVTWDGRSRGGATVSSGTYFYRLRAGDATIARRMVLLK